MFFVLRILFVLLLIGLVILCIRTLKKNALKKPFSYRNVSLLGLTIFLAASVLDEAYYIPYDIVSGGIAEYGGDVFLLDLVTCFTEFIYIAFPVVAVFAIFLAISNIVLLIKEGKSLTNMLGLALSFGLISGSILLYYAYDMVGQVVDTDSYAGFHFAIAIESTISILLTYLECMLVATAVVAIKVVHYKPNFDKNYLIILGCFAMPNGKPSVILRKRIDAAFEFAMAQKKAAKKAPIIIASGGQGADEVVSEAECIKNYLVKTKKYREKIILEDNSTTTRENFRYSKKLLKKYEQIAFVTTDYHVFRSGVIAEKVGLKNIVGIGAKSPWYYYNNALIREYIANMNSERKFHIKIILFLITSLYLLIVFSYIFRVM